jgi:hypothetical protein
MQLHLDIDVENIDVAEPAVLALGATRLLPTQGGLDRDPAGDSFRVYADPAGHPFCLVRSASGGHGDDARSGADGIGRLGTVVLEARDPAGLAGFYSGVLDLPVIGDDRDWVDIGQAGATRLSVQRAPGHQPPVWPDPASSMQFHLDIEVDDIGTAEQQVLALGAVRLPGGSAEEEARGERAPSDTGFRVYADPAGHPFCLTWG